MKAFFLSLALIISSQSFAQNTIYLQSGNHMVVGNTTVVCGGSNQSTPNFALSCECKKLGNGYWLDLYRINLETGVAKNLRSIENFMDGDFPETKKQCQRALRRHPTCSN